MQTNYQGRDQTNNKRRALLGIGVVSLLVPFSEVVITGSTEPFGVFTIVQNILLIVLVYYWYHIDKTERHYQARLLGNVAVVAVFPIGLAIYFVRSRGWREGLSAVAKGVATLVGIGVLGAVGASLGSVAISG